MRKELLAVVCVLTMLASTAPIFAAGSTNTVVLTSEQQAKLDTMQSQLTDLLAKIQSLKTTYKDTRAKGLLRALTQFEKQAKRLNTTITNYEKNPTASANRKIRTFQFKTKQLQWKVAITEKNLKKAKKAKKVRKNCSK
jgi:peptidoglycan hydrolase CwlO-like protein